MLFNNNDIGDTNAEFRKIATFINDFTVTLGIPEVRLDGRKLQSVVEGMHYDFPHVDGEEVASVFKKVANFVCYFVASAPISGRVPENYSKDLNGIDNSLTAVLAFAIASKMLHEAEITWTTDGTNHILTNQIEVSKHSYVDIIDALSSITPINHFKIVAVFFEQLAYKANPECQYPLRQPS